MSDPKPILSGIRVIEVGTYIMAPAAATVMSDFGAEVIKIEPPGMGDPLRMLHHVPPMPTCDIDYCFQLDGRNKKSLVVDLKRDEGRAIVLKLVEKADVFLTNYQPSVLDALRLRYEDIAPLNERLIYAHGTGYGELGPDIERPGYDMTAWWARSGLMDVVHAGGADPALSVAGMGDHPTAVALFGAIMLGLFQRERTGKGGKVRTSLMASGAWTNSCLLQSVLCGAAPYHPADRKTALNAMVNHYAARDGKRFILTGIRGDRDWANLCKSTGREDLMQDPRFTDIAARRANSPALIALLDETFAEKDMAEWDRLFTANDLTYSPAPSYADVTTDEQLWANEVFVEMPHPQRGTMATINSPLFVDGTPKQKPTAAPTLGQHTDEVLQSAGYAPHVIAHLREQRVIA